MSQWYSNLIWPELLGEDLESEQYEQQPELPDENWSLWRQQISAEAEALLRKSGCAALLTWVAWGTEPYEDAPEPKWVSPDQLLEAVASARRLMTSSASRAVVIEAYHDFSERGKSVDVQFLDDLAAIEQKAMWAKSLGKQQLSFNTFHSGSG
jgi:hypothetical protein